MTGNTRTAAIQRALSGLGQDVVSLYLPRPAIETGGEKWRILKKNALAALAGVGAQAQPLADELEKLETADFRGLGIGLFSSPRGLRVLHLTHRPHPVLKARGAALMVPALADAAGSGAVWAAVADRDAPRLMVVDGGRIIDRTAHLAEADFGKIEGMRDVESEVLYHSAARGGASAGDTGTHFHSLGTDPNAEMEKAEEEFHGKFAKAVEAAVPPNAGRLVLFGDPHRAGRCAANFKRLDITQVHLAGDALTDDRIAAGVRDATAGEASEVPGDLPLHGPAKVVAAAKEGRVATVFLSPGATGLEPGAGDEHTEIAVWTDETADGLAAVDQAVVQALAAGAGLVVARQPVAHDVAAQTRWD